jgi:hypothetical protein
MTNPEFKARWGSARMRYVEKDEKADIREANDYLTRHGYRSLCDISGYYTDHFQDDTATPVLLAESTPCQDCEGLGRTYAYIPGVRGPNDEKGAGCFDFEDTFIDAEEAARAAHELAKRYAEAAQEDDVKFQCEQQIEDGLDLIRKARQKHSVLIVERDEWRYDIGTLPAHYDLGKAHCATLRRNVSAASARIKLLREKPWLAVEY